ncbi:hypothetical protein D3C75_810480 [compost metagenome]
MGTYRRQGVDVDIHVIRELFAGIAPVILQVLTQTTLAAIAAHHVRLAEDIVFDFTGVHHRLKAQGVLLEQQIVAAEVKARLPGF